MSGSKFAAVMAAVVLMLSPMASSAQTASDDPQAEDELSLSPVDSDGQDLDQPPPAMASMPAAPDVQATLAVAPRWPLYPSVANPQNSVFNGIPNPVGAPLFNAEYMNVLGPFARLSDGISMRLQLDPDTARYRFTCPSGLCDGFAADVWRAMPNVQRERYLSTIATQIAPRLTARSSFFLIEVIHWEFVGTSRNKSEFVLSALRYQANDGAVGFSGNYIASLRGSDWAEHLP